MHDRIQLKGVIACCEDPFQPGSKGASSKLKNKLGDAHVPMVAPAKALCLAAAVKACRSVSCRHVLRPEGPQEPPEQQRQAAESAAARRHCHGRGHWPSLEEAPALVRAPLLDSIHCNSFKGLGFRVGQQRQGEPPPARRHRHGRGHPPSLEEAPALKRAPRLTRLTATASSMSSAQSAARGVLVAPGWVLAATPMSN